MISSGNPGFLSHHRLEGSFMRISEHETNVRWQILDPNGLLCYMICISVGLKVREPQTENHYSTRISHSVLDVNSNLNIETILSVNIYFVEPEDQMEKEREEQSRMGISH
jgi:hypothetical protein